MKSREIIYMSLALTGIRTSGCMAECAVLCPLPQIMEKLRGKNTGTALIPCQGHSGPHSSYPEQYSKRNGTFLKKTKNLLKKTKSA